MPYWVFPSWCVLCHNDVVKYWKRLAVTWTRIILMPLYNEQNLQKGHYFYFSDNDIWCSFDEESEANSWGLPSDKGPHTGLWKQLCSVVQSRLLRQLNTAIAMTRNKSLYSWKQNISGRMEKHVCISEVTLHKYIQSDNVTVSTCWVPKLSGGQFVFVRARVCLGHIHVLVGEAVLSRGHGRAACIVRLFSSGII